VAIGMTFVILTGGIDLSVGSVVGLTGVILGLALHHFSIPVAIALATLSGAGIGLFSGLLIAYFDLAAFVITLGVMAIGRSLAYIFSGQTSISDIPPELNDLVYTTVLGVQTNVLTLLALRSPGPTSPTPRADARFTQLAPIARRHVRRASMYCSTASCPTWSQARSPRLLPR
jgi:ABC-type xylose transport system permease subunit